MRARWNATTTRRWLAVSLIALTALAVGTVAAPATAETINVPIDQVAAKGDPGSTVRIGGADVDADLQGRTCEVEIVVTNQVSEHPGNVLIITSGESTITVENIEDTANAVTEAGGTLTLGSTIEVSVQLGNSNITSLGSNLEVTCEALPPTPPTPPVVGEPPYTG